MGQINNKRNTGESEDVELSRQGESTRTMTAEEWFAQLDSDVPEHTPKTIRTRTVKPFQEKLSTK